MSAPKDNELMFDVRNGEISKLAILFERHHLKLFNFFTKMTFDRDVSEDLVQEVFLRILKYRHTYRGESRFTFWMFRIARNAHADHFRKNRREDFFDENIENRTSEEPLPLDAIEYGQDIEILQKALQKLPAEKREVLVLSRFQNLKYHEIADLMNCKVGTIKLRVHRAMKDLRNIFFTLTSENLP